MGCRRCSAMVCSLCSGRQIGGTESHIRNASLPFAGAMEEETMKFLTVRFALFVLVAGVTLFAIGCGQKATESSDADSSASQTAGDLRRQAAQSLASGIDQEPVAANFFRLGRKRFHNSKFQFGLNGQAADLPPIITIYLFFQQTSA